MEALNVLYEDNHVIVVEKPIMMPVNPDDSHDDSLLDSIKRYIKVTRNKPNEAYVALVHRLDRPVGGVMVFALSAKAASRLSDSLRNHQLVKRYVAIIAKPLKLGTYEDRLLKDEKNNFIYIGNYNVSSISSRLWNRSKLLQV
jgi:23S rRNA pseudouridine1911/1915/1917 synthase